MNTSTHTRSAVDTRDENRREFGAGMTNHPPDGNARQRTEDDDKALIQSWRQKEKDINAVLISACAISFSVVYHIMNNIRRLEAAQKPVYYQQLYAAVWALMSQRTSSVATPQAPVPSMLSHPYPVAPEPSPSSRIIRMNMIWITSLVFNISTVFLAMLARQRTRDLQLRLIRQQFGHASKSTSKGDSFDEHVQGFYMSMAIDTMYRLFQVALVVFLLGHIDAIVHPISATFLTSVFVCGMLYIFRVIGPT